MARFTVSDCMETIENRYELTLCASIRARQLSRGAQSFLNDEENDKPNVIALREIAENKVNRKMLDHVE